MGRGALENGWNNHYLSSEGSFRSHRHCQRVKAEAVHKTVGRFVLCPTGLPLAFFPVCAYSGTASNKGPRAERAGRGKGKKQRREVWDLWYLAFGSLGCEWRGEGRHGRDGRGGDCLSIWDADDITAPLGISSKHYAVSIPVYLHPVYRLPDHIISLCVCVCVCVCLCCCNLDNRFTFHPERLLNDNLAQTCFRGS